MSGTFIEITQDAAAVLAKDGPELGVYTDNITSCIIYVLETDKSYVIVHDSGQLTRKNFIDLMKSNGKPKRLHSLWPTTATSHPGVLKKNRERYAIFCRLLKLDGNSLVMNTTTFNFTYSATYTKGSQLESTSIQPSNLRSLDSKDKRQSIIELNNNFAPLGKEALEVDVQYANGKYQPLGRFNQSIDEMLDLVEEQIRFYHENIQFLAKAHLAGVIHLDSDFLETTRGLQAPRDFHQIIQRAKGKSRILI